MGDEVKESRKEILMKAWEEAEGGDEPKHVGADTASPEDHAGDESAPAKSVEAVDETDKAPEKSEKGKEAVKEESPDKKEARAAADLERKPVSAPATGDKPPNSWKPATREHWSRLPPEVRAEVSRRELEIQQELSKTAQVRRFAQDFANTINPYSHLIRAQNSTPLQAVNN